ncbi:hypothetical protein [Halorubrum sp. GN11GM_10-3_MGM]|uniref:hypothetical protein n=1 Tax=Halorubrum sp. GN11GM_10-3_MGM TaxID=2518111 RepID=UPI0010F9C846|nr:hypothetical protein [Halorubrum sp. GN11GM_10-3_MGM]TKX72172.1 hypothetical protein EXE40_04840 [Halorubrum sp. GN11GM_10-3_MGM]
MPKKTVQTKVDEQYADAFETWAKDKYGSKAGALRDFVEKAPKGESVHSEVTNADLEAQLDAIEDKLESGVSVQQTQQTQQNGSEDVADDPDPMEVYDPELDAEDLPDVITPEYDDTNCIKKDVLEGIVEEWEDTGDVPTLNPLHISSDHRPQGGDTPVALGIGIIQHRYNKKIRHSSVVDVLAADNGGLGYTEQYVRENGHAHAIGDHLVTSPNDNQVYILDDDYKQSILAKTENDIEREIEKLKSRESWERFRWSVESLDELLHDLDQLEGDLGIVSDVVTAAEVNTEVIAAGEALGRDLFHSDLSDAEDAMETAKEQLEAMESAESRAEYMDAKSDLPDIKSAISSANDAINQEDRYSAVTADELNHASEVRDRLEELKQEKQAVEEEKMDMLVQSEEIEFERRQVAVQHLYDMALSDDGDLSVAQSAVAAIDDVRDYRYEVSEYADLEFDSDANKKLRTDIRKSFAEIERKDYSVI